MGEVKLLAIGEVGEAAQVVAVIAALPRAGCTAEVRAVVAESVGYLTKRLPQMQYAADHPWRRRVSPPSTALPSCAEIWYTSSAT